MSRKCLAVIATFALFFILTASIQAVNPTLETIRANYSHIQQNLKSYRVTSTNIPGESTEAGVGLAYYEGRQVKLIEITRFGETGKYCVQYYFNQDQVFFALETEYTYNRPIYWNKKAAHEVDDSEVFNMQKTTRQESRYYFQHEQLISWLDNNKKEHTASAKEKNKVGKELIADAHRRKTMVKK